MAHRAARPVLAVIAPFLSGSAFGACQTEPPNRTDHPDPERFLGLAHEKPCVLVLQASSYAKPLDTSIIFHSDW